MLKIRYYSDLHDDNRLYHRQTNSPWKDRYQIPVLPDDSQTVLVLAGDIDNNMARLRVNLAQLCQRFRHVIFVPGNHDYYDHDITEVDRLIAATADRTPNLTAGNKAVVVIDDVMFACATGWTQVNDPLSQLKLEYMINDYKYIRVGREKVRAFHLNQIAQDHHQFFAEALKSKEMLGATRAVAVSHHCPWHMRAGLDGIRNDSYTPAYVDLSGSLARAIEGYDYSISGHIHVNSLDGQIINNTKVLVNCVGYGSECEYSIKHQTTLI